MAKTMVQLPTIRIGDVPQGGVYVGYSKNCKEWKINIIIGRHSDDSRIKEHWTLCADFEQYLGFLTRRGVVCRDIWQFPDIRDDVEVWFTGIVVPIRALKKEDIKALVRDAKALEQERDKNYG